MIFISRNWDTFYVIIVAVNFIVGNEFVNVDPVSLQCKNNYSFFSSLHYKAQLIRPGT